MKNLHFGRVGSLACTDNLIITGSRDGHVSIQDCRLQGEIMRYRAHKQEICGLKINPTGELIATGGNDNRLLLFSMRKMNKVICFDDHKAAVKAIDFSKQSDLLASGSGTADRRVRLFSLQTYQQVNEIDTGSQVCNLMFSPISN